MPRRSTKKATKSRLDAVGEVASRLKSWRPAIEVLTRVEAQPTIFVQLDEATRVGGWPIQRFGLVHGPPGMGKTSLVLGLGLSFLRGGGFFAFIDAEMTTPNDWMQKLMGEYAAAPGFVASRPRTYEAAVNGVREFMETIAEARDKDEIPKESTGLVVVDSIRKLVPKNLLAKILAHGAEGKKGSIDGAGGRAGQMRAAINAQWLDELVPLLYHTRCAMVFVSREYENPDAGVFERRWKIGGGRALEFDSSMLCRVTRPEWIKCGDRVVGERHRVEITKSKVAGKDTQTSTCYFHTSNGQLIPEGFDRARDIIEAGVATGILDRSGISVAWDDERFGTINDAVKMLTAQPEQLAKLEAEVRCCWKTE